MSGINGDKSRFHRERKKKIARRKRNQELASQQLQPVCGHPASQKPTSGARGADVRGPEIQLPAWTAGFQNPAAAQVSPASPLSEPETRTGPRRFASRLSEFPSAETDLQKHRLTVLRSSLSGGLARYPAGLKTLPPLWCVSEVLRFAYQKRKLRGVALRMSSQNLSRWPSSFPPLMRTKLYRSARHQERASLISAAQSTSMPSLRMISARKSRLVGDLSTRRTRFFLSRLRIGSERGDAKTGVVMRTPPSASKQMLGPSACTPLPNSSTDEKNLD